MTETEYAETTTYESATTEPIPIFSVRSTGWAGVVTMSGSTAVAAGRHSGEGTNTGLEERP